MQNVKLMMSMVLAIFVITACASSKEARREDNRLIGTYEEKYVNTRFEDTEGRESHRQIYDMNHDKGVDLWKFYKTKQALDEDKPTLILLRKEIDANFDGRIDNILYYNDNEELIREELDLDFDGFVELIRYYSGSVIAKVEYYTTDASHFLIDIKGSEPGFPNMTKSYRSGILTREEVDADLDGKPERITIYDATGKIMQQGRDGNHDGEIEEWLRF